MGNRALKVEMVILFFFILLSVVSSTRMAYWLECLRMFEDPNARKASLGEYAFCRDDDRALYYVYQSSGRLPRSYVKALRVFFNGNRTKVHNYIVNGEWD